MTILNQYPWSNHLSIKNNVYYLKYRLITELVQYSLTNSQVFQI